MNDAMNDARTLVQLVTFHALLQREDVKIFSSARADDQLMSAVLHLSDKYMEKVVGDAV
jgi:hypothetical protein